MLTDRDRRILHEALRRLQAHQFAVEDVTETEIEALLAKLRQGERPDGLA